MATITRKRRSAKPPAAESLVNNAPRLFTEADFPVGSVSHQGDLILVRITALPAGAKRRKSRQLAEGQTMGSRHVVERGAVYQCAAADVAAAIKSAAGCEVAAQYIGPVFVSPASPTEHDLDHPEHGHQGFPPGAVMACVYQRNLDAEQREQRTCD